MQRLPCDVQWDANDKGSKWASHIGGDPGIQPCEREEDRMRGKWKIWVIIPCIALFFFLCSSPSRLIMHQQVTGPIKTNCYLLYDTESREAALIDVGGPVDSLIAVIEENELELKYIFITHSHADHIVGLPDVSTAFTEAKVGMNKTEYEHIFTFAGWMEKHKDQPVIAALHEDPNMKAWLAYDMSVFKEPDLCLEDGQMYSLGKHRIRTILTPGHSAGSICFYVDGMLFSGDVLFYRRVGITFLQGGSDESITRSVQRLYDELPDETRIYPGHGPSTDIGTEKRQNEEVTVEGVLL